MERINRNGASDKSFAESGSKLAAHYANMLHKPFLHMHSELYSENQVGTSYECALSHMHVMTKSQNEPTVMEEEKDSRLCGALLAT